MAEDDGERWLTYAELGALLGCTPNAARVRAQRHGWPRRAPNSVGGRAAVLAPKETLVPRATHIETLCDAPVRAPNGHEEPSVRALVQALDSLREQLAVANTRADQAEAHAGRKDAVIDHLRDEIRFLHGLLTSRRPWWRRWRR